MNKLFCAAAAAGAVLLAGPLAQAAGYPEKPVTMIVPFVPGGSSDITARSVTPMLSQTLGQTFVVENKPGANSAIGAQALARSTPDGYTMMVGSIGTFAINEALYKNLAYNPSKDFTYLTQAVRNPNVLVAATKFPASTVAELVAYAKKNPGSVSYASSGTGSSDHLSAVLFRQRTGSTGVDVPYKGGGAAIADLLGGQVNVSFQNLGAVQNHIKAGKLKALAITGDTRATDLPNVPTLAEAGIKDMVVYSWQGFAVPKATPPDVVEKLSKALQDALRDPKTKQTLQGLGFEVVANTPQQFAAFQQAEVKRWKDVIQKANIQLE
ncbi:tripartite tricarboxylate transporter substrate binding protein [Achromobacter spanius]|jgi:tripartite-type tricarboxylate transporter receptor subunit TctC|uniref:Bug family tripartite tricarboxylate transporter substrate binding protein n=1 Tax=Achromobacter TaxID=222 RepID=UPI000F8FAC8E|nr:MULTISPECIES: tripartite tricarboxylate transporter substrate binding protein [Achromobacter]AZS80344.1 tripartite tricarboxylate transporter substrate binding protein [Achromobacter spanius]MCD0499465.1 tripartite tricarboxylate transporter substrate binding protein [Achromobacter sp. MY14]MCW3155015.1 tripartite tricarboxylate transporter substrate binding protein [Achromobacter spanius]